MPQKTNDLQDSVLRINGTALVGASAVARLFSLDHKLVVGLLEAYSKQPGGKQAVYVGDGLVFMTGQGVMELARVFPNNIDVAGLEKLAEVMRDDAVLAEFAKAVVA